MNNFLLVGFGGFLGSIGRYLLILLIGNAPVATIVINLLGCFCIGIIDAVLTLFYPSSQNYRLFIMTGILGGFTTFSAFGLEGFELLKNGSSVDAFLYIFMQVLVGILMVWSGEIVVRKLALGALG